MNERMRRRLLKSKTTLTLEEARLLARAAWDGPDPDAHEQQILDRVLERIERVLDEEIP